MISRLQIALLATNHEVHACKLAVFTDHCHYLQLNIFVPRSSQALRDPFQGEKSKRHGYKEVLLSRHLHLTQHGILLPAGGHASAAVPALGQSKRPPVPGAPRVSDIWLQRLRLPEHEHAAEAREARLLHLQTASRLLAHLESDRRPGCQLPHRPKVDLHSSLMQTF